MNDLDLDVSDVWIGADAGHTVQLLCFVHQDGTTEYGIFGSQNTENLDAVSARALSRLLAAAADQLDRLTGESPPFV